MVRFGLFSATSTAVMVAFGILPLPDREDLPDFSLADISIPAQPAFVSDIADLRLDLPDFREQVRARVMRVFTNPDVNQPILPAIAERTSLTTPAAAAGLVNFGLNKDNLDAEAKARLDDFAEKIAANQTSKIEIFGHTDLTGPEVYNDNLGLRRARQVAAYLIVKGVSPSRIDMIASEGETSPVIKTEKPSRENRRVNIEMQHNI